MRVAILTTDTRHHRYFVRSLSAHPFIEIDLVVYELQSFVKSPWDNEQIEFEKQFFGNRQPERNCHLVKDIIGVTNINNEKTKKELENRNIDVGIVFGTSKIKPEIFTIPRYGCINVHRGISQHYRGLDSELWAVYRRDFENVGVTIHYIDENLDTGDILAQVGIGQESWPELYMLRAFQTRAASYVAIGVMWNFVRTNGNLEGRPQEKGQYYGAMSYEDKLITLERYNAGWGK